MKALFLIENRSGVGKFEMRETETPEPDAGKVRIAVEASGINFADVMAGQGLYREAPPKPCVLGYEVVGRVDVVGGEGNDELQGKRVVAFTKFGGYAEYVVTDARALSVIDEELDPVKATALATQYCTAWYAAEELIVLHAQENVLVHAASGGVGTALVQMAKRRGCTVLGTTGSEEKFGELRERGVDHPMTYEAYDREALRALEGERVDVAFNSIGGKTVKRDMKLCGAGGRVLCYGGAERSGKGGGILSTVKFLWDMGLYHPVGLLARSKSLLGVNLLKLANYRPQLIATSLQKVVSLTREGELSPVGDSSFPAEKVEEAHERLMSRKSRGKVALVWK